MSKPRVLVFGSSHAKRLFDAMIRDDNFRDEFELYWNVKSGATIENFTVNYGLLESLSEDDFVIVNFLCNDWLHKNIEFTYTPQKVIHLTKFEPKFFPEIATQIVWLGEVLERTRARVIILDNPLRHIRCCNWHRYPGLIQFWRQKNHDMRTIFSNAGHTVLEHQSVMRLSRTEWRQMGNYTTLFSDTVHFKPYVYCQIARFMYHYINHLRV